MKLTTRFIIATLACLATAAPVSATEQPAQVHGQADWKEQQAPVGDRQQQLAIADKAQAELAKRLMDRLSASISEGGPAAGIEVCSSEAPGIASAVAEANQVRIGRTSHKLRNPANSGPAWVARVVEDKSGTRRYFSGPDGTLAVATPIPLGQMCAQCHGPVAGISAEVKAALAKRYPQDTATGFEVGEVRGWFWVEVPRQSGSDG